MARGWWRGGVDGCASGLQCSNVAVYVAMWRIAPRHRRLSRYAGSIRCVILPLGRPAYLSFCLGQPAYLVWLRAALLRLDYEAGAGGRYPLLTLLAPLAYLIVMMCQLCRRRSSSRLLAPFRFRHTYLVVTIMELPFPVLCESIHPADQFSRRRRQGPAGRDQARQAGWDGHAR